MEIALGTALLVGLLIFGFGYGLLSVSSKYIKIYASLWILFILALMGSLMLFILQIIHGVLFVQIWLGYFILAMIWIGFAKFGRYIAQKRLEDYVKTQQRINSLSQKQDSEEEKE